MRRLWLILLLAGAALAQPIGGGTGSGNPPCSSTVTINCSVNADGAGNVRVGNTLLAGKYTAGTPSAGQTALPAASSYPSSIALVVDCESTAACTTGGGATASWLRSNGTAWGLYGSASVAWGSITGTLSSQTDLNTALGTKPTAALVTVVGSPGSDSNVPSEESVRTAIAALNLTGPGYFFPNLNSLFDPSDVGNFDPRGGGLSLCTNWKQFYLPWAVTINTYRFQIDGSASDSVFYAGIYTNSGALVFDIGNISLAAGAGLYGPGAAHDTGTYFFDSSRTAQTTITLPAGWYYYGWGASGGTMTFPAMNPYTGDGIWVEVVGSQVTGTSVGSRYAHSGTFDIAGGHLPTAITTVGGAAAPPPNIAFFVQ